MQRFLNYELQRRLGRGGSADVWQARTDEGEAVAVKLFVDDVHEGIDQLRAGEAERLARIAHPRILRYLGAGRLPHPVLDLPADSAFIVTELVDGPTLSGVRTPDWAWVQSVTLQLLDALAAAHARNIVHLDVKPTNVLLREVDPPDVVLADFGIAHRFDYEPGSSASRPFIGTPPYMAPEQIQRYVADFGPWTDIYSLGCIVYELCTGRPPFVGERIDVLRKHFSEPPPELSQTRFRVPDRLDDWLGRCLVKDTAERFARAADAAWALVQVCRGFDAPADVPTALRPDELVVPESTTITWVGADLQTLGGPAPPTGAPGLPTFPTAALPANWSRGQDAGRGSLAELVEDLDVADAVWSEFHRAFRHNEARGVVLVGADFERRNALLNALITRVFEFGVGTHVLLRHDDERSAADRTILQLFRADHFSNPAAASVHCEKLIAAIAGSRPLMASDAHAIRDWVVELVDGTVTIDPAERTRLAVEVLRSVPRTPLVLIEGHAADRIAFATALLAEGSLAGTGAIVIVSDDTETDELAALDRVTTLSLDGSDVLGNDADGKWG